MPGKILYAPSGSGKSYYIQNIISQVDGYALIDGDRLYTEWPPGRWWLDTEIARRTEQKAMSVIYDYIQQHDKCVVFTGLPIEADATVLISYDQHISNLSRRDGSSNQPTIIDGIDRSYRSGRTFSNFDTAVRYLISRDISP